jgi:hypothetical protein
LVLVLVGSISFGVTGRCNLEERIPLSSYKNISPTRVLDGLDDCDVFPGVKSPIRLREIARRAIRHQVRAGAVHPQNTLNLWNPLVLDSRINDVVLTAQMLIANAPTGRLSRRVGSILIPAVAKCSANVPRMRGD